MRRTTSLSLTLLVFLSLCLITFSVMTLSGAISDQKLCEKSIDRTMQYYQADAKLQSVLADLDTCLAKRLRDSISTKADLADHTDSLMNEAELTEYVDSFHSLPEELSSLNSDCVSLSFSEETSVLLFDVMIREDQCIRCEVSLTPPQSDEDVLFQVRTKKVVNLSEWTADHTQNVLQAN